MAGSFGVGGGQLVVELVEPGVYRGAALFVAGTGCGSGGHVGFGLLDLLLTRGGGCLRVQAFELGLASGIAGVVTCGELGVVGGVATPQHTAQGGQCEHDGNGLDPHGDDAGLDHWQTPGPQPMVLA